MGNKKISLVLSGGGARGMAHIGVIEVLQENGFEICSIAGTSMGALVGGVYAQGKIEEFKEWLYTLDKRKVFSLIDFTISKQGLIKGERVLNKMKDFIPDTNIEDMTIPYVAVATDLLNRKEVIFDNGRLFDAIRASIAIPAIFTPVRTNNGLLVDGGVLNNIPLNHVKRVKGDIVVAVNVNSEIPPFLIKKSKKEMDARVSAYKKKINEFNAHLHKLIPINEGDTHFGYLDLIDKTISLMTNHMSDMTLRLFAPDILINISKESCTIFDFYRAEELVEIGRHAAKIEISNYIKTNG